MQGNESVNLRSSAEELTHYWSYFETEKRNLHLISGRREHGSPHWITTLSNSRSMLFNPSHAASMTSGFGKDVRLWVCVSVSVHVYLNLWGCIARTSQHLACSLGCCFVNECMRAISFCDFIWVNCSYKWDLSIVSCYNICVNCSLCIGKFIR